MGRDLGQHAALHENNGRVNVVSGKPMVRVEFEAGFLLGLHHACGLRLNAAQRRDLRDGGVDHWTLQYHALIPVLVASMGGIRLVEARR